MLKFAAVPASLFIPASCFFSSPLEPFLCMYIDYSMQKTKNKLKAETALMKTFL